MKHVDPWVQRFIEQVLPRLWRAIRPQRMILFGSRIRGEVRPGSDLDVIVVAEAFQGMSFFERMPYLLRLADFDKHIDFFCYTPEEFQRIQARSFIIEEAVRTGWHLTAKEIEALIAALKKETPLAS